MRTIKVTLPRGHQRNQVENALFQTDITCINDPDNREVRYSGKLEIALRDAKPLAQFLYRQFFNEACSQRERTAALRAYSSIEKAYARLPKWVKERERN